MDMENLGRRRWCASWHARAHATETIDGVCTDRFLEYGDVDLLDSGGYVAKYVRILRGAIGVGELGIVRTCEPLGRS